MMPDSGQGPEDVVDFGVIQDVRDLMEDDFADLVQRFLGDAADLLEQMDEGAAQGDAARLHRAAHTLKSSAAALGATGLSELARQLEALGRAGSLEGAAAPLEAAHAQLNRVRTTLEDYLAGGP